MPQGYAQVLVAGQADGPTLTAAAAASCIPTHAKWTFPPSYFYPGKVLRLTLAGRVSTVITTPGTLRWDVRIGGAIVFDSLAILPDTVAAHTTIPFRLEIILTCRTIGSGTAATIFGNGILFCEDILGVAATMPKADAIAVLPWNTAPVVGTGFDSSISNTLDVFFTQTVATGSMTVHQYIVEDIA